MMLTNSSTIATVLEVAYAPVLGQYKRVGKGSEEKIHTL